MGEGTGFKADALYVQIEIIQISDNVLDVRGKLCLGNKLPLVIDDTEVDRSQ